MTLSTTNLRQLNPKTGQLTSSKVVTLKNQYKIVFVFLYLELEKSVRPERGLSAHNKRSGGTGVTGPAGQRLSQIQLGGSDNRCTMADGKAMVHHHFLFKIIRPEEEPGHIYLLSCVYVSRGRVAKSHFHVNQNKKGNEATRNQHV